MLHLSLLTTTVLGSYLLRMISIPGARRYTIISILHGATAYQDLHIPSYWVTRYYVMIQRHGCFRSFGLT